MHFISVYYNRRNSLAVFYPTVWFFIQVVHNNVGAYFSNEHSNDKITGNSQRVTKTSEAVSQTLSASLN